VRALTALARLHLPPESNPWSGVAAFITAVAELDAADDAYRTTIGACLPAAKAQTVLAALTEFRSGAAQIRARVRLAVDYGDFDPLDAFAPPLHGSHADSVRRASLTDAARGEVAGLRARVNEEIGALLERAEIEALLTAKRSRNAAFDRILRSALPASAGDKLATQLLLVVDGWY
jgi:hypothetical protein